jgi:hypothetical protein
VITPSGLTSSNYDITYSNGALSVSKAPLTVTAAAATKTYDGQAYSGGNGVSYSGFVNSETSSVLGGSVSYSGTSQGAINAGSYVITPSGLTSSNYDITYSNGALSVSKAPLTVTANNASKTYGDANPTLSTTVSGFVNGETLATSGVAGTGAATTTATTSTGAGTATITASVGSLTASNYNFSNLINGTLTINKAPLTVTNSYQAAIPIMTAVATPSVQLPNVPIANMTGLEIRSLSPEQLNSLTREQITNLNPAQLQALTTTQISKLNPEKVENLLPSQLSVMSARQLEALPGPVSPSNSSSSTGILSVTILHSPETKVAAPVGIAYEQNANSISLTSTSAPAQPISSDGVVFNGKLTTFMVATKNGELVAFEGGLVNNRIVIVANTNVAKQIAQSEINLVLAAAVTSLNKEGNLLAQLEGVVLDLR